MLVLHAAVHGAHPDIAQTTLQAMCPWLTSTAVEDALRDTNDGDNLACHLGF